MAVQEFKSVIEALIFSAREPISAAKIRDIIEDDGVKPVDVRTVIDTLNSEYERDGRAFRIFSLNDAYEFRTSAEYGVFIEKLFSIKKTFRLSKSALETVAIIAYNQPVTRIEIEMIRSVNVSYTLTKLLELELIKVVGQKETPGKPLLYGTTGKFLEYFGLNSIQDLPEISSIEKMVE